MRVWEFDRLGAIASEEFDINKDGEAGLRLVSTILGFLWMEREQLGVDPTINLEGDRRVVTIQRDGKTERLILDKLIKRAPCISGRATTCWKAYPAEDPQMLLVITNSWQYTERDEEGELLKEATDKGFTNVARYYHHETVHVRSQVDEIHGNIRGGLISTDAKTYQVAPSSQLPDDESKSGQIAGVKRSLPSQADRPPAKRPRPRSMLPTSSISKEALANRVHRRVIGLWSEDKDWHTRAFMAIGVLLGKQHSFMHDIESFFWVLFWLCIHSNGPDTKGKVIPEFEQWNFLRVDVLARAKLGTVCSEEVFMVTASDDFTPYYRELIPLLNELRQVAFPGGRFWSREDEELYSRMREVLRRGRERLEFDDTHD
ncbi:hypothetical protein TrVFT333_001681 [Trichoderma virens FT-333]|nr:hypothetical protein TrVFT333_001681 [Trichoderma virens FT-333]